MKTLKLSHGNSHNGKRIDFNLIPNENIPFLINDLGQRVPNPLLSSMEVSKAGKLVAKAVLKALYAPPVNIPIPDLVYEGPQIFKVDTIITNRNFRSTDSSTPAIQVWNGAKLEMSGCTVVSCGDLINASGNAILNIHHNDFYGDTPTNNSQYGRALNAYQPRSVIFNNNYVEHTGGLLIDHSTPGTTVQIYQNIIRNTDKRRTDLTLGDHRAGILFNTCPGLVGFIRWNFFQNLPGISCIEDNTNFYNSGGTQITPYEFSNNYIYGAYPYPLTADSYTGSGLTVDGDPGTNQLTNMSQFINAFSNQVISTCNACMNIAAGHDIHFYNNTMISSGMFPDGTTSSRFWGGCCIWDASNVGPDKFINNTIKNNVIGYARPGVNVPLPGRQDFVTVANNLLSVVATDNTSLPNPITLDLEAQQLAIWQDKVKAAGVTIGNVTGSVIPPVSGFTCVVGETLQFQAIPADDTEAAVSYKTGSLVITSDGLVQVSQVSTDETLFSVVGKTAGVFAISISLHTNADKVITKNFTVTVSNPLPEATHINIVKK